MSPETQQQTQPGKHLEPSVRHQVLVSRKARFSAAHFYYLPELTEQENQKIFYACSNRFGHGHNYELEMTVKGPVDNETGMVVNLTFIKQLLDIYVVQPLDHKHLNHQIEHFKNTIPTLENIEIYLWQVLSPQIKALSLTLTHLKLVENEELFVEHWAPENVNAFPLVSQHFPTKEPNTMVLFLTRRYYFSASHRLYNDTFSEEQNWEVFGLCNNPNGHGHNYELEVTVSGERDTQTGMVVDIVKLDAVVKNKLLHKVDHKHFNLDVDFMGPIIPTAENIVVSFWQELEAHIPEPARLFKLRLIESRNNAAEYYGEKSGLLNKTLQGVV